MGRLISEKYAAWQAECEERFQQLKKNEEELNRIFIDIYGLQDELTPDVADKDVTVHRVLIRVFSTMTRSTLITIRKKSYTRWIRMRMPSVTSATVQTRTMTAPTVIT